MTMKLTKLVPMFPTILSTTIDPPSIAHGAGHTTANIAFTGAELGDVVVVAPPYDMQGITAYGFVASSGNIKVQFNNLTGGAINLAGGIYRIGLIRI